MGAVASHHLYREWRHVREAVMQTKASHHLWHTCSPLLGATIRAKASRCLCQTWGYLIGATMLAEAGHCCAGLEGISERLCLKLAAACAEYLKLLEKAQLGNWVGWCKVSGKHQGRIKGVGQD